MHGKASDLLNRLLPYLLLAPQLAITLVFFYWPAVQAVWQSFLLRGRVRPVDRIRLASRTIATLFAAARILPRHGHDRRVLGRGRRLSLSLALLLAVMADKPLRGAGIFKTLLIWPYAVAPAVAGVLWIFMFQSSLGMLAQATARHGHRLESAAQRHQAMMLVILAAAWKQISYNFLFFLAGLQAIPKSVIEAAAIDGARPMRRFWTIVFPLLSPTTFFLIVVNIVYVFFDTFGIIDTVTGGGPAKATRPWSTRSMPTAGSAAISAARRRNR